MQYTWNYKYKNVLQLQSLVLNQDFEQQLTFPTNNLEYVNGLSYNSLTSWFRVDYPFTLTIYLEHITLNKV